MKHHHIDTEIPFYWALEFPFFFFFGHSLLLIKVPTVDHAID